MISWNIPTTIFAQTSETGGEFAMVEFFPDLSFEVGTKFTRFTNFSITSERVSEAFASFMPGPSSTETDSSLLVQDYSSASWKSVTGTTNSEGENATTIANTRHLITSTTDTSAETFSSTVTETEQASLWTTVSNETSFDFTTVSSTQSVTISSSTVTTVTVETVTEHSASTQNLGNTYGTVWQCNTSDAYADVIWSAENTWYEGSVDLRPFSDVAASTTKVTFFPLLEIVTHPFPDQIAVGKGNGGAYAPGRTNPGSTLTLQFVTTQTTSATITEYGGGYPITSQTKSAFFVGIGSTQSFPYTQATTVASDSTFTLYASEVLVTAETEESFDTVTVSDGTQLSHVDDIVYLYTESSTITEYFTRPYLLTTGNGSLTYHAIGTSFDSVSRAAQPNYQNKAGNQTVVGLNNAPRRFSSTTFKADPEFAETFGVFGAFVSTSFGAAAQIDIGATFRPATTVFSTAALSRNDEVVNIVTFLPTTFTAVSTTDIGETLRHMSVTLNPPQVTVQWFGDSSVEQLSGSMETLNSWGQARKNSRLSVMGGAANKSETVFERHHYGVYADSSGSTTSYIDTISQRGQFNTAPTVWKEPIIALKPHLDEFLVQTFLSVTELRNNYGLPPGSHLP